MILFQVQQTNVDDEEIARAINAKLGESTGISYTEIASKALECGRTFLAIRVRKTLLIMTVMNFSTIDSNKSCIINSY